MRPQVDGRVPRLPRGGPGNVPGACPRMRSRSLRSSVRVRRSRPPVVREFVSISPAFWRASDMPNRSPLAELTVIARSQRSRAAPRWPCRASRSAALLYADAASNGSAASTAIVAAVSSSSTASGGTATVARAISVRARSSGVPMPVASSRASDVTASTSTDSAETSSASHATAFRPSHRRRGGTHPMPRACSRRAMCSRRLPGDRRPATPIEVARLSATTASPAPAAKA